jgi:5-methylcytosine-specific restriction enzyme subunit McrC
MNVIEMEAWSKRSTELSHDQAAELASLDLVQVVAQAYGDPWLLVADSRIGVATGGGWELRVKPRLAIPKLFFLLAYAADPDGWKDESAEFAFDPDLLDAVASGFSWHALNALERGVLHGYVRIEERLPTIRGRVRFAEQIARSASLPLPVEVSYDDYIADIIENQMLKTATVALLRLPRLPALARKRLLKLRGLLDDVSLVDRPREVTMPTLTRLNERYGPSLRLAELILHASSIDAPKGPLVATAFVFDMNKVFEDFVSVALDESMQRFGGEVRPQWSGWLDVEERIGIRPDITWWTDERCLAVADAKYKALELKSMPNADAYQMLAYCTSLGLPRGFLVYAKDSGEETRSHAVRNSDCVIEVRTLDVEAEPESLLGQVNALADEIAGRAAIAKAA